MAGSPPPTQPQGRTARRLVLLSGDEKSTTAEVLSEYNGTNVGATKIHADLLRAAQDHPGQFVAVEWLATIGWTRYLWCKN